MLSTDMVLYGAAAIFAGSHAVATFGHTERSLKLAKGFLVTGVFALCSGLMMKGFGA